MKKDQKLAQRLRNNGFSVQHIRGNRDGPGHYIITSHIDSSTETIGVIENGRLSVVYGSNLVGHDYAGLRLLGQIEGAVQLRKRLDEWEIPYSEETPIYGRHFLDRAGLSGYDHLNEASHERREISREEVAQFVSEAGRAYLEDLVNKIK